MSDDKESKLKWLWEVLSSSVPFRRLLLFVLFVVVLLVAVGEYVAWRMPEQAQLSFGADGATIIYDADRELKATFRLPASARWVNTGIRIPPKAAVQIQASGRIHLAVHHLVNSAVDDTKPTFPWLGPDGQAFDHQRYKDIDKKQLLVMPDANIGCLLAALHLPGGQNETEPNIANNPRPKRLFKIGKSNTIQNTEDQPLELWLVVNEMFLDSSDAAVAEKQYRVNDPTKLTEEQQLIETKRWEYVRDNSYWDLWWDDNIGDFYVTIQQ